MILERRFVIPENVGCSIGCEDEKWAEVGNGYYVNNYGHVWSSRSNKYLKPKRLDKHGHVGICMRTDSDKVKYLYLHRLVAEAFIPNPNNYPIVRHLDDDPTHNTDDNLAWGTQRDNMEDCRNNGNDYILTDEDRERSFEKIRIPIISKNIKTGEEKYYKSISDAARDLGLWGSNIQKVLYGERMHTGGFSFERNDKSNE